MKKEEFETFLLNEAFTKTSDNRNETFDYVITISHNEDVQVFRKAEDPQEKFIIRQLPPVLVAMYNLKDVELKDGKVEVIKRRRFINGT